MHWLQALRERSARIVERPISKPRRVNPCATLATHACLGPEGSIDNIQQDASRIRVGENTYCRGRLLIYGHGGEISIGSWSYVGLRTEIWSMNSIEIGDNVLIAHDVNIHDGNAHSLDPVERHAHYRHIIERGHPRVANEMPGVDSEPIVIEDDVWISFGVTILKGVRIGAGSVIAARSIVTDDVPPGVLYRNQVIPIIRPLP
jgi:acetyltransferase-like isoleucine patch superfamily enzyme